MLLHPTAVDGPAPRRAPAAWSLAALALVACALEHLAGWSIAHHGPLGERAARAISEAAADGRLYRDDRLFEPWQPWSYALLQEGWWQLGGALAVVLLVGRALEAELGTAALIAGALAITPLGGIGALIGIGEPGLGALACGLFGLALARRPAARVRWGLSYYAIVEVGHVPLFRMRLAEVATLYVASDLLRCWLHRTPVPATGYLAAAFAGAALGLVSRKLRPVE
jgi:membrane associated rhomboid family serine protease